MGKTISLKVFQFLIVIAITGIASYYLGLNKVASQGFRPVIAVDSQPSSSQKLDMDLYYATLEKINEKYYDKEKIQSQEILYGSIQGMLQSLDDPYTSFFPPKQNTDFKAQLSGQFQGIGAELGISPENRIMVISPLDDSPAKKGGLKAGDLILEVDGNDTSGWTLPEAVEKIRGERGSKVKLTILHEGAKETQEITITRDVILVDSVKGWVKTVECKGSDCQEKTNCPTCASVGYVRLSQFGDRTNEEWVKVINALYTDMQKNDNFKGIVLDVRNNPGGYLQDAVYISSEFLKEGNTVVVQDNNQGQRIEMKVTRKGLFLDTPIIVLTNKGSASASEIVAGALRDNKRARIIGENSFGKGTIQEAIDVGNGASIHISVAKWLTPNGTWVHKTGLKPDVEVKYKEPDPKKPAAFDNQLQKAVEELTKN